MRIIDILKQTKLQHDFVPTDNAGVSLAHCDFGDSTPKQKLNRPLKADGAAGTIAINLLGGRILSIQDIRSILAKSGITSNDEGRRKREAESWLIRQGLEIGEWDCVTPMGVRFKRWFVKPNPELQQAALAKLKGKK